MVADTSVVNMLQESLTSPAGCLFPYRNITSGETDFEGLWAALLLYWTAVRDTFPTPGASHQPAAGSCTAPASGQWAG